MALDRFYNQDEVLSKQPTDGQIFDNQDKHLLDGESSKALYTRLNSSDITGIDGITQINVEKHYYAGSSLVI